MKKIFYLLIFSLFILFNGNYVYADEACNQKTVEQLAKIIYNEMGSDYSVIAGESFFVRITVGSTAFNHAYEKSSSKSWYDRLYSITDTEYSGYSTYKDKSFDNFVAANKSQIVYAAGLVLSGKYNIPNNIVYQCSKDIFDNSGAIEWTHFSTKPYDTYFGYTGSISTKDAFQRNISDTSVNYYRNLAKSLELSDYSKYTSSNVCSILTSNENTGINTNTNNTNDNSYEGIGEACTNPDVLKVIQFILILIDIVRIGVPIGLIILGSIDFSKVVISGEDKDAKNNLNLFIRRIIYAVLVFAVPWIVKTVMILLGNLTEEVNFTDCLENANSEKIKSLEGN